MKITYNQLVEHKACKEQRLLFKDTFGDEVVITEEICKKYYNIFDFGWVVYNLFPSELYVKYYQDIKSITDKYIQDINDKYTQDCVMIFYKYSLTLP